MAARAIVRRHRARSVDRIARGRAVALEEQREACVRIAVGMRAGLDPNIGHPAILQQLTQRVDDVIDSIERLQWPPEAFRFARRKRRRQRKPSLKFLPPPSEFVLFAKHLA